jgi:outer membrane lipoprotein-sorting protein
MTARILFALGIAGFARADSLDEVLKRIDTAASAFHSYSANVKMVDYTKIIDLTDKKDGMMRLQKVKNGVSGIVDFSTAEDPFVVHLNGAKGEKFLPKVNEVQEYDMGNLGRGIEQMLLLGFSVPRAEMLKDYAVTMGGAEKVDALETTRIMLTPKSKGRLKLVSTVELWIPAGKGYPIQIKETSNSKWTQFTFSGLQLNPSLPAAAFELPASAARAHRTKVN